MPPLAAESPAPSVAAFDDDAWEDLLNFIEGTRATGVSPLEVDFATGQSGCRAPAKVGADRRGAATDVTPVVATIDNVVERSFVLQSQSAGHCGESPTAHTPWHAPTIPQSTPHHLRSFTPIHGYLDATVFDF